MEFKGTKGEWTINETKKGHQNISSENWEEFCKVNNITNVGNRYITEARANALLISKAPEMLEMLNDIYELQCAGEANDKHVRKRVLELIKQATEL